MSYDKVSPAAFLVVAACGILACGRNDSPPTNSPQGEPKKGDTKVLEKGAEVLQSFDPVKQIDIYVNGFHVMKDDPTHFMEAHHFCRAKNEEFIQCVIYDANTEDANLIGVEYIISEKLFNDLPEGEKDYWHPHNFEILSGQLVGPGLPDAAEKAFFTKLLNGYGKTWHVWDTGHIGHPQSQKVPVGAPALAWSFNADGEAPESMVVERDRRMKIDSVAKRRDRADLAPLAHPQRGADALEKAFPGRKVPDFMKGEGTMPK